MECHSTSCHRIIETKQTPVHTWPNFWEGLLIHLRSHRLMLPYKPLSSHNTNFEDFLKYLWSLYIVITDSFIHLPTNLPSPVTPITEIYIMELSKRNKPPIWPDSWESQGYKLQTYLAAMQTVTFCLRSLYDVNIELNLPYLISPLLLGNYIYFRTRYEASS